MSEHWLKTWPHSFAAIKDRSKRFEYRDSRDRDFDVGDFLILCLWDPQRSFAGTRRGSYVGRNDHTVPREEEAEHLRCLVTHILHGGRFGVPVGYCVMSIELLGVDDAP